MADDANSYFELNLFNGSDTSLVKRYLHCSAAYRLTDDHMKDLDSFVQELSKVFETYCEKNPKYGDCWREDDLDVRGIFAEISAKHRRLKSLVWDQNELMTVDDHRAIAREVCRDTILYYLFMVRRIQMEYGDTRESLLTELRAD